MQLIGQNVHLSNKSRNCLFTIGQLVISNVYSVNVKHWLPFRLSRSHWANICLPITRNSRSMMKTIPLNGPFSMNSILQYTRFLGGNIKYWFYTNALPSKKPVY